MVTEEITNQEEEVILEVKEVEVISEDKEVYVIIFKEKGFVNMEIIASLLMVIMVIMKENFQEEIKEVIISDIKEVVIEVVTNPEVEVDSEVTVT